MVITIRQIDALGTGKDRVLTQNATGHNLLDKLFRIKRAYNLDNTHVSVDGGAVNWDLVI